MTSQQLRYEVQRSGRTWSVYKITRTKEGVQQELIEGGFFSRLAAQRCKDALEAERLIEVSKLLETVTVRNAKGEVKAVPLSYFCHGSATHRALLDGGWMIVEVK